MFPIIRVVKAVHHKDEAGRTISTSNPAEQGWRDWAKANNYRVLDLKGFNYLELHPRKSF